MTVISIEHVAINRGGQCILNDVSLRVERGDRIALIGPNGSGKTTLLRAILGLIPLTQGRILLDGEPVARLPSIDRAARVAWLPQQALADEAITTLEFVLAARYRFSEPRLLAMVAALRALKCIDAEAWASRLVTQLSGGEQQRIALAALLAQESQTLLADEPANHLDPAQQVVVWKLLGRIAASGTMIVVTHDINWVPWLGELAATRVVALKQGQLLFDVKADDALLPARLGELYGIEMLALEANGQRVIVPTKPQGGSL
jgi:iron complex transport system ATP-binding protein